IQSDGGGVSIGVAQSGGGVTGALVVGASIARNEIASTLSGTIDSSTVTAAGSIGVNVDQDATITALSVAASLALGSGSGTSITLIGGGAEASNVILTEANASATGSDLTSGGAVTI